MSVKKPHAAFCVRMLLAQKRARQVILHVPYAPSDSTMR